MTQQTPSAPSVETSGTEGNKDFSGIVTPLAGIDPRSLDAIMAGDPELMPDADVDRIVAELRNQRRLYEQNEAAVAAGAKRTRGAKAPGSGNVTTSLKDLGLV